MVALVLASVHCGASAFSFLSFGAGIAAHAAYQHHKNASKSQYSEPSSQKNQSSEATVAQLPASTGNFGGCQEQFANGTPPVVKDIGSRRARALCFNGFAVMHSGVTKTPIYVAEVLNRQRLIAAKGEQRTNAFFSDARLPASERALLEDYRGSGFDRGHNAPAGDQGTDEGMAQSFSLANMMPQAPKNNRGAWADIEMSTRKYAMRAQGNVYVITGSILLRGQCPRFNPDTFRIHGNCQIGSGVTVPSHIYKLVYDASTKRAWAHWIENSNEAQISQPISYEDLVSRVGIEFLPGIHLGK